MKGLIHAARLLRKTSILDRTLRLAFPSGIRRGLLSRYTSLSQELDHVQSDALGVSESQNILSGTVLKRSLKEKRV